MDRRIESILQATEAIGRGDFHIHIPTGDDDLGRLGQALRRLGMALEARIRELQTLSDVTARVNAGFLLEEVLDYVYDSFRPIIPYDRIGFALLDEKGTVTAAWARSETPALQLGAGYSQPLALTSLGAVLDSGTPRILNDLAAYLEEHPKSSSTRLIVQEGMRSSLTCPLTALARPVGFIFFSCKRIDAYVPEHVVLFRQIAGQLAMTLEKSRLYQRLVELNEEKNRFLGIAAHDLRNPIGIAGGFARLLLQGAAGEVSPTQGQLLRRIDMACTRMQHLVDDLLDLSAIEAGRLTLELEEVDLAAYLSSCLEALALLADSKGIALEFASCQDLRTRLDPRRLEQVLVNLLGNAVKFSEPGTRVTLSARRTDEGVQVDVEDQGPGIPESELLLLFQPFQRASTRPTGGEKSTGLGLAISRRIVEAHGGRSWARSQVGRGSVFSFTIPERLDASVTC